MQICSLAHNVTEIEDCTGTRILISYHTPVAILHPDGLLERTLRRHSVTTQRHINSWKKQIVFTMEHNKPQEHFDTYLAAL